MEEKRVEYGNIFLQLQLLHKAMHKGNNPSNLQHGMFLTLLTIARLGEESQDQKGVMPRDVCQQLSLTKPAMSQRLNQLETQGYIRRVMSNQDRRAMFIQLTPTGEQVLADGEERLMVYLHSLEKKMGKDKLQQLSLLLEETTNCLNDVIEEER